MRGDLLWKGRVLASVSVHVLTPGGFLTGLVLTNAVVSVRLASSTVSATAFVPDRCETLVAAAVLRCQTALTPIAELSLRVHFREEATGTSHVVPIALLAATGRGPKRWSWRCAHSRLARPVRGG